MIISNYRGTMQGKGLFPLGMVDVLRITYIPQFD